MLGGFERRRKIEQVHESEFNKHETFSPVCRLQKRVCGVHGTFVKQYCLPSSCEYLMKTLFSCVKMYVGENKRTFSRHRVSSLIRRRKNSHVIAQPIQTVHQIKNS
jgi:hypothetical protein